jgi:hypothetical protein
MSMSGGASGLPVGLAGLRYGITQVSLAVRDMDGLLDLYYKTFGWAPWQVFRHSPPIHHATELRGAAVDYSMRGAEVYVGSLNFELLDAFAGPNLWSEFVERRGEGIASIATMFLEREDGDAVKAAFLKRFGIPVSMRAEIGDHIEYYYLDTEDQFGCLIESGSGHAIDFVRPVNVHPNDGALAGPSPTSGLTYQIRQVSLVVRDLDAKMTAFAAAFGWGPWHVYESGRSGLLTDCTFRGAPAEFNVRWAQVRVGDLNFELIEPLGGTSPWQEFLDVKGEGIVSIAVPMATAAESDRVKTQFRDSGIGILASARVGGVVDWYYLDTESEYKTLIASGTGLAAEVAPTARAADPGSS